MAEHSLANKTTQEIIDEVVKKSVEMAKSLDSININIIEKMKKQNEAVQHTISKATGTGVRKSRKTEEVVPLPQGLDPIIYHLNLMHAVDSG